MARNMRLVVGLLLICLAAALLSALAGSPDAGPDNRFSQIALFRLRACNSCNNARRVIEQFRKENPAVNFIEYDIENDSKIANVYGIKYHPTLLFLNQEGLELNRLEKRQINLGKIKNTVSELLANPPAPIARRELQDMPKLNSAAFVFHLVNKETGQLQRVRQFVENRTEVDFAKIAAITYLLSFAETLPELLENPIPRGVTLKQSIAEGAISTIILSDNFAEIVGTEHGEQALFSLVNTLLELNGVKKVKIQSANYESPVFAEKQGAISKSDEFAPAIEGGWTPEIRVFEYNANILHEKDLAKLPCHCGCSGIGHKSNFNCFFQRLDGERLRIDMHAESCSMCLDITNLFMKLKAEGKSLAEIRAVINERHGQ